MSAAHDPLDELAIPDGTTVEEHDVVTDGDVLIGSNSQIDFGVRGRTIAAGERVQFGRQIEADGDCRLDIWCRTEGSVFAGEDAYIGERTHIGGKLLVSGDLDIGDDVTIEQGFEANGWIVTRNPVPVLVFYFIVLSQFLRLGESDKANEFASALAGSDIEERAPLVIPRGAELSDDAWRVSTPARIGSNCRLHGNIRAESIKVGTDTTVFGSLRARGDIDIDTGTVIIGDVTTRSGTVTIQAGAHVRGDVSCGDLVVHEGAVVDGMLRARGEMKLIQQAEKPAATDESAESARDPEETATADEPSATATNDAPEIAPIGDVDDAPAQTAEEDEVAQTIDGKTADSTARDDPEADEGEAEAEPAADTASVSSEDSAAVDAEPTDDHTEGDTGVELLDETSSNDEISEDEKAASTPAEPADETVDRPNSAPPQDANNPDSLIDPAEREDVEIIDAETDESVAVAPADSSESSPTETESSAADAQSAATAETPDQQPNPDSS